MMRSYDYTQGKGLRNITWQDFPFLEARQVIARVSDEHVIFPQDQGVLESLKFIVSHEVVAAIIVYSVV
jgi:hypothetical protein